VLKDVSVLYSIGEIYKILCSKDYYCTSFKLNYNGNDLLCFEKTLEEYKIVTDSDIDVVENWGPPLPDFVDPVTISSGLLIFMNLWNSSYVIRAWMTNNSTIGDLRKEISKCLHDAGDYNKLTFKVQSMDLNDAEKTLFDYNISNRISIKVSK
jgi:hypothetical protein